MGYIPLDTMNNDDNDDDDDYSVVPEKKVSPKAVIYFGSFENMALAKWEIRVSVPKIFLMTMSH